MLTRNTLSGYIQARPFRPFQIRTAGQQTFDIRHPEMVRVGTTWVMIFTYTTDQPDVPDAWHTVSLMLVESVSFLDAPVT